MKNLNLTQRKSPDHTNLVENFKRVGDEVMVLRKKVLREEGLTLPGLFIMHFVSIKGPMNLTDCPLNLGVSKPRI